ncbi:dihydrofolate reductase family protein [uncultured Jannaschia sp.]|uniref:dihydrofolate reductase family protein n=1 Tax=uncultured Jannaschia sp. TaxID=293347 RepID=UPI00261145FC|nr:dihydrofolate reductase family protein [uncultured Jannaschia sp.]
MQPIIYDVAVSGDGFICGPGADISRFPHHGAVVDDYRDRLATYGAVIMGRATYEFGFAYGLSAGENPYPGMVACVVSTTLDLPGSEIRICRDLDAVEAFRAAATAPVYLCGGGALATAMKDRGLIDEVVLKRAPILLGGGVPLWSGGAVASRLLEARDYGGGVTLHRYALD